MSGPNPNSRTVPFQQVLRFLWMRNEALLPQNPTANLPFITTKVRFSFLNPMLLILNPTPARLADDKSLRVIKECNTFAPSSWDASGSWLRCSLLSWVALWMMSCLKQHRSSRYWAHIQALLCLARVRNGFGIPLMPGELLCICLASISIRAILYYYPIVLFLISKVTSI